MSKHPPPDPKDLVERDERSSHPGVPGWYLDPTSNGTRERFWTGVRWNGQTRGSGPLRRQFRGLPADLQAKILAALFFGAVFAFIILTGNSATEGCQYGGSRFDYTC